jgi:hypothetical protein
MCCSAFQLQNAQDAISVGFDSQAKMIEISF